MLLLPYKADVSVGRWPVLTLAVCAVCIWVFTRQFLSAQNYSHAVENYCNQRITRAEELVLHYLPGPSGRHYCDVLLQLRNSADSTAEIEDLARQSRPAPFYRNPADSVDYVRATLTASLARFKSTVPNDLTESLHFDPNHPTLSSMLTAAFSHGSWWHLISNLIFFYAFAASVEVIAGPFFFLTFVVLSAIGTHLAYRYSVAGVEGAPPTVGLSGVVMTMMTFLATILPTLNIRCFFWLIVFVRIFRVPALIIAGLYIFENIADYATRDPDSNVNYVAHISGAAIGGLMGLWYRYRHREFLEELRENVRR